MLAARPESGGGVNEGDHSLCASLSLFSLDRIQMLVLAHVPHAPSANLVLGQSESTNSFRVRLAFGSPSILKVFKHSQAFVGLLQAY